MSRLIDANIVLCILTDNKAHTNYAAAIDAANQGGIVRNYVFPEIEYGFRRETLRHSAWEYAIKNHQEELYEAKPRQYVANYKPSAGWKQKAMVQLRDQLKKFFIAYPNVVLEDSALCTMALDIGCITGFDCVDCMLLAEYQLGRGVPVSVDKDIAKGIRALSSVESATASKGVSKMNLT